MARRIRIYAFYMKYEGGKRRFEQLVIYLAAVSGVFPGTIAMLLFEIMTIASYFWVVHDGIRKQSGPDISTCSTVSSEGFL